MTNTAETFLSLVRAATLRTKPTIVAAMTARMLEDLFPFNMLPPMYLAFGCCGVAGTTSLGIPAQCLPDDYTVVDRCPGRSGTLPQLICGKFTHCFTALTARADSSRQLQRVKSGGADAET